MPLADASSPSPQCDVAVVGAGVLGVAVAHWVSLLYDCRVVVLDSAPFPAAHTSSRNTGVIHRPFYLDPSSKKTFAASADLSLPLWRALARSHGLPWSPVGTIEVANEDADMATLERYREWGGRNGVPPEELVLLDRGAVARLEPEVRAPGAIHSKGDVSVDYGAFTRALAAGLDGARPEFVGDAEVAAVGPAAGGLTALALRGGPFATLRCRFMVNAAGGGAVDVAHMDGVGSAYTDLHFRGDYWLVDEPFASRVGRNVYSVARRREFPFLDPHFVVRADGTRQIGPNAALVAGPRTYEGLGGPLGLAGKFLERPVGPKLRLASSTAFLSLVWSEWRSSFSKGAMCQRVRRFIPGLSASSLTRRGLSGIRSSLIGPEGFVPEALLLPGERSLHVLNYNSPGATGAPVFSALVVERMKALGAFEGLRPRPQAPSPLWSYDSVMASLGSRGLP